MTHPVNRTIRRITPSSRYSGGRARAIVIEIHPPGDRIVFRLAGCRTRYAVAVGDCFALAVNAARAAKRALRKRKA